MVTKQADKTLKRRRSGRVSHTCSSPSRWNRRLICINVLNVKWLFIELIVDQKVLDNSILTVFRVYLVWRNKLNNFAGC